MAAQLFKWGGWALKSLINPAKPHRSNALKVGQAQQAAETRQVNIIPRWLGVFQLHASVEYFLVTSGSHS